MPNYFRELGDSEAYHLVQQRLKTWSFNLRGNRPNRTIRSEPSGVKYLKSCRWPGSDLRHDTIPISNLERGPRAAPVWFRLSLLPIIEKPQSLILRLF
jgi:hypothetical protein